MGRGCSAGALSATGGRVGSRVPNNFGHLKSGADCLEQAPGGAALLGAGT